MSFLGTNLLFGVADDTDAITPTVLNGERGREA
jgi:hypothetical protein